MSNTSQALDNARVLFRFGHEVTGRGWLGSAAKYLRQDIVMPARIAAYPKRGHLALDCGRCHEVRYEEMYEIDKEEIICETY